MIPIQRVGSLFLLLAIFGSCASAQSTAQRTYTKQQKLYIGVGACNNGEMTISENHKNCATRPIGYTIDAADAKPEDQFVELFAGNGVPNNGIVSPDDNHGNASTESIGYISIKPIRRGAKVRAGDVPGCNAGIGTLSTMHLACKTRVVGYTLPLK